MNTSIDWIYDLEDEYKNQTSNVVINISDWNNEDDCIEIPKELIIKASNINPFDYSKYYFIGLLEETYHKLNHFIYQQYNIRINTDNILLVNNSTYALFLTCKALKELKLKRILLITPCYFSIEHNLNELNFTIIYYHLTSTNNFSFCFEDIEKIIDEQFIDAVFITNPIFNTGIAISNSIFEKLFNLFIKKDMWIVVDNTLDQLNWNNKNSLFNEFLLSKFKLFDKLIYIDSSTKKLFINGLKHAVIISKLSSLTSIKYNSDCNIGSLTVNQVNLMNEIYNLDNIDLIEESVNKNINLFQNNYQLSKNLLQNSNYYLTNSACGFHSCIMLKNRNFDQIDINLFLKKLIYEHGILLIPLNHFLFHKNNDFGFRINLSKHPYKITKSLKALINIDF